MKRIMIVACLIPFSLCGQPSNNSTIRGVVTYFFNKYQGDKADIGAEVYILDSTKAKKFNDKVVDSFHYANFYRNLAADYKRMDHPAPDDVKKQLSLYHGDDDQYFKGLDGRNYSQFLIVKASEENYSATVDGSGKYSINLKAGVYYVFIKSHNRIGMSISEISGKIFYKKVKVRTDQSINISNNFELD